MVYCTKCGIKNLEDAEYCVKCGSSLEISFKEWGIRLEKGKEPECFGIHLISGKLSLFIGVLIVLIGIFWLLNRYIPLYRLWSVVVIGVGLYIIVKILLKNRI